MRWNLRLDTALRPDITIAVRLAPDNEQPMDYYLLPQIDIKALRLRMRNAMRSFLTPTASTRSTAFFTSAPGRAWGPSNDNCYQRINAANAEATAQRMLTASTPAAAVFLAKASAP